MSIAKAADPANLPAYSPERLKALEAWIAKGPRRPLAPSGVGDQVGRIMGTKAPSKFSRDVLVRDIKAGVLISVPFEAVFSSQKYRRGEIKANEYVASVVANSMGFGMWTLGGALAAAALAPLGAPIYVGAVLGFGAGMLANDLWDRTFGKAITKIMPEFLPEGVAKPVANGFSRFVANPLHDYIWKPISGAVMGHKVLSCALLACAALKFPTAAKIVGREISAMALGTGLALGIQLGLVDRVLAPADH